MLIQFNTWATTINDYEGNQWTLSWEMRGSMLVFLVLTITADFKRSWRRVFFILTAFYYFKSGEFLGPFCFFAGAILAEVSLLQSKYAKSEMSYPITDPSERIYQMVCEYWPFALAILALLLASVPPENPTLAPYSATIWHWFDDHITTTDGISPIN